jgi:hypothetical protein
MGRPFALRAPGFIDTYRADMQKAIESYEQALPLFRAQQDRFGESVALQGFASAISASVIMKKRLITAGNHRNSCAVSDIARLMQ